MLEFNRWFWQRTKSLNAGTPSRIALDRIDSRSQSSEAEKLQGDGDAMNHSTEAFCANRNT